MQSTAPCAERSAETSSQLQIACSVDEGLSIERTLQADGAPPDTLRGLSGDNFRFTVAHADRGLFEARKEGYLRQSADGPLKLAEGPFRPTEDLLRHTDGALNSTEQNIGKVYRLGQSVVISMSVSTSSR